MRELGKRDNAHVMFTDRCKQRGDFMAHTHEGVCIELVEWISRDGGGR